MSTIAKGEITLSPVNDAYTVLITPASCTITADFDGSNPHLDNAKGTITVKRGTLEVPFKITGIAKSSDTIAVSYSSQQATTMPFAITQYFKYSILICFFIFKCFFICLYIHLNPQFLL